MSRLFDGVNDAITFDAGGVATMHTGAVSIVYLIKINANHRGGLYDGRDVGTTRRFGINPFDNNSIFVNIIGQGFQSFDYSSMIGEWGVVALTKAGVAEAWRYHLFTYSGGTWTHTDITGQGTIGNGVTAVASFFVGSFDSGQFLSANLAVEGFWTVELSDGQIEGLVDALADWVALSPAVLHDMHGAVATPITDIMGSGADQTAITGTTDDVGDDPPGFNYSLGPNEGSAAFALDLALAGVGARRSAGVAALGLNLAVATAGARPSRGAAAIGLGLGLATAGARASRGAAALGLRYTINAHGPTSAAGRPARLTARGRRAALVARGTPGGIRARGGYGNA